MDARPTRDLVEPFDPAVPRVMVASEARAPRDLRDPFAPDHWASAATPRPSVARSRRPSEDLRDPFAARLPAPRVPAASRPVVTRAAAAAPHRVERKAIRPAAEPDLRDPFGR
ncbi:MAG: hypothetical protein AB1Z98_12010 [Nannocystaceae bacterium]